MAAKRIDISEAYDEICRMKGTYVICFDIVGLMPINDISREAGDLAILESLKRIEQVCTENMLQLRIGGDEFALITGSENENEVKNIIEKVLAHNGEKILWNNKEISVSLRTGLCKVPDGNLRYNEFFEEMHEAINSVRKKER